MNTILRLKTWPLFILTMAPMILLKAIPFDDSYIDATVSQIGSAWVTLVRVIWFWAIVNFLTKTSHLPRQTEFSLFMLALFIQILTVAEPVLRLQLFYVAPHLLTNIPVELFDTYGTIIYLVALLYSIYFVANGLSYAESVSQPSNSDRVANFLLLLFFPLCIIGLQERLNLWPKKFGANG
ncbi:hypothetical protein F5984_20850 [Rudanella paleaurantiibacter]|uniref:Uncharacterized protein n=1 Tax=Rudanella paleaurantiibacter TaxID=2614655 RepID=A0A7J5TU41_9BACT|nr:hypothetical protein [Rudanella paleaurantiibacter]KAB7727524.1 hypothetical protein F5984_20850 [Rudanella paleaurantiibacter]